MPEQRSSSGASPRHERSPFIPDELLPWFEPVTTGRATLEFPQSGGVSDVTTADVRRMSGGGLVGCGRDERDLCRLPLK